MWIWTSQAIRTLPPPRRQLKCNKKKSSITTITVATVVGRTLRTLWRRRLTVPARHRPGHHHTIRLPRARPRPTLRGGSWTRLWTRRQQQTVPNVCSWQMSLNRWAAHTTLCNATTAIEWWSIYVEGRGNYALYQTLKSGLKFSYTQTLDNGVILILFWEGWGRVGEYK